jgi:Predicted drug exporters of the RND superfamily
MVILTLHFGTVVAMLLPILYRDPGPGLHAVDHHHPRPRDHRLDGRADPGHHDRARRRDRLRAVHRDGHLRGLNDGLDLRESIARAVATSGGAVVFAGSTVTIALVSLAVANIPLVTTMGLMAAIAVIVAVLAALTLLPAMLSITGPHINSLRVRGRHPGRRDPAHPHKGLWARWAEGVARHPVIAMVAALAILIPLAVPLLSLNLGQKDVAALSTSTTERRAYDLISQNFGPGAERAADHRGVAGLARATPRQ